MVRLICSLALLICASGLVQAAASGTLANASQPVTWSGSVGPEDGGSGAIAECASTACESFSLTVNLPNGVWNQKPGGVQIAVRWRGQPFDNLRLYVYKAGVRIAAGEGIISVAQSVLVPLAVNGVYHIYIARDPDSPGQSIPYEAIAEVEYPPNEHPARPLLPDLTVLPQRNLSFDPGGIFFDTISDSQPVRKGKSSRPVGAQLTRTGRKVSFWLISTSCAWSGKATGRGPTMRPIACRRSRVIPPQTSLCKASRAAGWICKTGTCRINTSK